MKKVKYRSKLRLILGRKLLIATLILVQIVFLIVMLFRGAALRWIALLLSALSIATALHLMTRPEKAAFKLSLVFLILLFPVFGGVLYWVFHFQTSSTGFRKILGQIEKKHREEYRALCTLPVRVGTTDPTITSDTAERRTPFRSASAERRSAYSPPEVDSAKDGL